MPQWLSRNHLEHVGLEMSVWDGYAALAFLVHEEGLVFNIDVRKVDAPPVYVPAVGMPFGEAIGRIPVHSAECAYRVAPLHAPQAERGVDDASQPPAALTLLLLVRDRPQVVCGSEVVPSRPEHLRVDGARGFEPISGVAGVEIVEHQRHIPPQRLLQPLLHIQLHVPALHRRPCAMPPVFFLESVILLQHSLASSLLQRHQNPSEMLEPLFRARASSLHLGLSSYFACVEEGHVCDGNRLRQRPRAPFHLQPGRKNREAGNLWP
mmetsp:Transcript_22475/g.53100  ORF Transcript_22475/g.53100 Transcript_22475/m.53100 type:complete len:265 (-) Transcript_22475:493-1287(-)